MLPETDRRRFLKLAAASGAASAFANSLPALGQVSAAETKLDPNVVRFSDDIEPLVRLLEDTDRNSLMEELARRIKSGLSYQQLLAALFLAGVRNVQPRPSVGFKFHAVLVVNSAHLASLASVDSERWLPLFWAVDNFKSSQARDVQEGNWTMAPVDESKIPTGEEAEAEFVQAMQQWDEAKADAAVAGLARTASANRIFELFAQYGCRDFRSIGHKAIYVANSFRTLQCIGWHHAEPILRSLAYALLNHTGEPNPAENDLDADRPAREFESLATKVRADWEFGKPDDKATTDLLSALYGTSVTDATAAVVDVLNAGVSPQSVYDALLLGSGESLMRQPGIVGLHTVTTANAMHYLFQTAAKSETRLFAMLQNAAFLPMFHSAMQNRGSVADDRIVDLPAAVGANPQNSNLDAILANISADTPQAARQLLGYLDSQHSPEAFIQEARRLIFLKGSDSHDYKFSSAAMEDFYHVSPQWRNRFLATSVFHLKGSKQEDTGLAKRIQMAIS